LTSPIDSLLVALKGAIERGVEISFLLEDPEAGHIAIDSPGLIRSALPGARIYLWDSSGHGSGGTGVVHAKCVLADRKCVFITSANLTNAAMEKNMELGIKVTGGGIPEQLGAHFDSMIAKRIICPT
jgi:phosphatidylserine/phosphatidylglycerophosphate/cardiolipin synthase-like enzyme